MCEKEIKLTQYSHGAGCGCKIAPDVLKRIIGQTNHSSSFPGLLVGNSTSDDAAVYDLGDGRVVISTTDFFTPIVDDAFTFGAIAAVNALSDIYAMGGTPLMAIAILGWPIDKIPAELAGIVLKGAEHICHQAGIPLAGGHSIDSQEPIFGLAVTGTAKPEHIRRNSAAQPGDLLYLTKPLGVGIITTAQKQDKVDPKDLQLAMDSMLKLNKPGAVISTETFVHAMTDVTGFGLLGHTTELCQGSDTSAEIYYDQVPRFSVVEKYINAGCIPGGTHRNWKAYGHHIKLQAEDQKLLLADPQTSGGLLIAVDPSAQLQFEALLKKEGYVLSPIGRMTAKKADLVVIS
ncbi:MAG: selenide, water dikinase SelD [Cyclobacteriaceae bacterium]|nr:selenide, water dikinase SelD [Cyclobacteriaceae bacterium]